MYPSGSPYVVSTGISSGIVRYAATAITGAARKNQLACSGASASLRHSLYRS
jgi:hypothetical protein